MSYRAPILLTLCLLAIPVSAQNREFMQQVDRLAAPAAWERAEAIEFIAHWQGDIAMPLRAAWRQSARLERIGLLRAAGVRLEPALIEYAVRELGSTDAALNGCARDYLLALPLDELRIAPGVLDDAAQALWREFLSFRLRRDIVAALLDAYVQPGAFFGQFDALRHRDAEGLDRELLSLLTAQSVFAEPLQLAATNRVERGTVASRAFSPAWRRLIESLPALQEALRSHCAGQLTLEARRRAAFTGSNLQAALLIVGELRASAARALSKSNAAHELAPLLVAFYRELSALDAEPAMRSAADPERMRTEVEITLSRFGHPELLDARIERLRLHARRVQEAPAGNVNARGAARTDLMALNEVASLLLRAGHADRAEQQWLEAIKFASNQLADADTRTRNVLVSYMAAAYYNAACAQAQQLRLAQGIESLKAAVAHGYSDFQWMLEDGDLLQLRRTPEFLDWFERVAPPSVDARLRDADAAGD